MLAELLEYDPTLVVGILDGGAGITPMRGLEHDLELTDPAMRSE